jgi:hypothetical protein
MYSTTGSYSGGSSTSSHPPFDPQHVPVYRILQIHIRHYLEAKHGRNAFYLEVSSDSL